MTAAALRMYAVGMVFAACGEVLVKAFFAAEKMKIPMISSLISMTVNVAAVLIGSALLGERFGVGAIALLSALSAGVNLAVNLAFALRRGLIRSVGADWADIAKSVAAAVVMGAAVWFAAPHFGSHGKLLALVLPTLCGVLVYALVTALLRSEEMKQIVGKRRKTKNGS